MGKVNAKDRPKRPRRPSTRVGHVLPFAGDPRWPEWVGTPEHDARCIVLDPKPGTIPDDSDVPFAVCVSQCAHLWEELGKRPHCFKARAAEREASKS